MQKYPEKANLKRLKPVAAQPLVGVGINCKWSEGKILSDGKVLKMAC
jgi:hypothetical protein